MVPECFVSLNSSTPPRREAKGDNILFAARAGRCSGPCARCLHLEPPWNTGSSRRRSVRASGTQGAAEKRARRCGQPSAGRRGPVCRVADCASCRFAGLGSNFYYRVRLGQIVLGRSFILIFYSRVRLGQIVLGRFYFNFLLQGAFGSDCIGEVLF
jgi:hypothetical protein